MEPDHASRDGQFGWIRFCSCGCSPFSTYARAQPGDSVPSFPFQWSTRARLDQGEDLCSDITHLHGTFVCWARGEGEEEESQTLSRYGYTSRGGGGDRSTINL